MENDGYEFADYLQALMRLLSSMLVRDYEQTNSLALHTECRAGGREGAGRREGGLAQAAALEGAVDAGGGEGGRVGVAHGPHEELAQPQRVGLGHDQAVLLEPPIGRINGPPRLRLAAAPHV